MDEKENLKKPIKMPFSKLAKGDFFTKSHQNGIFLTAMIQRRK
jgi:hypothetical protein